ncbi:hypothetical protein BC629DRAFT_475578 [Irpex lacteus]|nr:hypothetical protein BC629DRAFT_475578 [Irpex lacteus]
MPVAASPSAVSNSNALPSASSPQPAADKTDITVPPAPEVHVNGKPTTTDTPLRTPKSLNANPPTDAEASAWGANFWVTLADPATGVSFYACPATGEVSWDPPVGNFLLPPSPDGEWWEMVDEASGLPYYYHTKSGETVWERPQAFVIPLTVLQNTSLARRLSLTKRSSVVSQHSSDNTPHKLGYRRSRSYHEELDSKRASTSSSLNPQQSPRRRTQSTARGNTTSSQPSPTSSKPKTVKRSSSSEKYNIHNQHASPLAYERGHPLAPIPGSPYATDASPPPSPTGERSKSRTSQSSSRHEKQKTSPKPASTPKSRDSPPKTSRQASSEKLERSRSSKSINLEFVPYRAPQPQSLNAALEKLAQSSPSSSMSSQEKKEDKGKEKEKEKEKRPSGTMDEWGARLSISLGRSSGQNLRQRISVDLGAESRLRSASNSPTSDTNKENKSASPAPSSWNLKHQPSVSSAKSASQLNISTPRIVGKEISAPVFDAEATNNMSPVKMRNAGKPILVPPLNGSGSGRPSMQGRESSRKSESAPLGPEAYFPRKRTSTLNTGAYPALPDDLASDIQQFSESQFARQYFSTHRTGFIFRRTVPVSQMMAWQKVRVQRGP